MSTTPLPIAQARIADCLELDAQGRLVQRRDHLNLSGLGLTDEALTARFDPRERGLPKLGLADLAHLRYLDLSGNELTVLPECVTGFTGLVWLGLNFNRISRLPDDIGALVNLRRLYLRGNALTELPAGIGKLRALEELDLTGDELAKLPVSMALLKALEHVALEEKALAPDLRAAWKDKGWTSLRKHLGRAGGEVQTVRFVGKVVLVGSQEHGKTCLQRALRGEAFIQGLKSTDGMSRERLHLLRNGDSVSLPELALTPGLQAEVVDLTLWDMGGQESYQHTHQMFFTPSAVYLVVTLPRQGGGIQELDKWIELVKRRTGGEATVIVVSTWCRKYPADQALTLEELRAKHGEMIRALVPVDSQDGTGIVELRKLLADVVNEPQAKCRHTWLPPWAKVLGELSNSPEPFLRWKQIGEICESHGIQDPDEQRQVIRTGHYIGALLWREDIPAGEDVVILNPDWLCRAVARLLDDENTRKAHGLVDIPKLDRVWSGPGRDGTRGYEPDTYPALIELMEINELAYRPKVPGKKIGEGHLLLITQMVEDMPNDDVENRWKAISPKDAVEIVRVIAFRKVGSLGYEDVPDIIYLLIFRLREFSLGRTDYRQAMHCQRGLLVTDDYGSAGRIELDDGRLRITVRHRLGEGLMHSIIHRIGVRDDGYWNGRGLEKVEFVPCGRLCAKGTPDAGLVSMESCMKADRAGNSSVECQSCHEFLPIRDLLKQRSVETAEAIQLRQSVQSLMHDLQTGQKKLIEEIRKQGQNTQDRITQLHQFIQMQGDGILDAFTSEWKEGPRLFSLLPIKGKGWTKNWTQMEFRVTIWCEASRRPVPLFRELKEGQAKTTEFRGSETITLTREWVQGARKALTWTSWATLALVTGGAAGVGGLVTATGGVISPGDAKDFVGELARQQKALKDVAGAITDDSKSLVRVGKLDPAADPANPFAALSPKSFGTPAENDLKLIRFLREEFKKKDPTWGGLVSRDDGKFGRLWAHPMSVH